MNTTNELSFQQQFLFQQGYQSYTPAQLKQLEWGLRFTPLTCALFTLTGLVFQQPYLLFAVSLLSFWAFFFPAAHPMDLLYNHVVRHLFGAVKLPPNPFQRRLACMAAGVMTLITGSLLLGGLTTAAWVLGSVLLVLQAIVITTHLCTLSWVYEGLMRLIGKWHQPVDSQQIQSVLDQGGILVDVRGPEEFSHGALPDARNIPLEQLPDHLAELRQQPVLLYCASGMRSQIGAEMLRKAGLSNVHDIGAMSRGEAALQQAA